MNNNRGTSRRRGRGNNRPQPSGRSGGMDQGNRIDSRARGNATQMLEKYKKMAHDAQMNGDRVATEYYLQFADHYFRVLADNRARQDEYRRPREEQGRDNGSDYADDDDDIGFNSGPSQRNYSQDQSDEASARSGQDDEGDDQDDNRGNRGNGNGHPRNEGRQNEGRQSEGRQNDNRQNEGRRERRPRDDNQERQGQERQGQERQGQERQNQDRQNRPRGDRQEQAPRAATPAPAPTPTPAETADDGDQASQPRRTLRGRGRPPRAAEAEGSNTLDPMILPPAIGMASEDKTEAEVEAPKPKRRAAPRRKAAESGDVEAAAAE